ncbi:xylose isomerase [Mycobacterium sp. IS-1742]|uniref:sugar phosphate isomerase/epimerase family protein n=1 Tax=Mycobacterium sp. IS-1742 TaxID=1772285 RepID=UPI00073FD07B|nr:TIM barrel protein [Mycobacterium sp. IS-1742]KUI32137.1 xylose isomerase [Mycobacterium sp. IS-1742]
MHDRLSVHSVTFHGDPLAELHDRWSQLGLTRLSLIDTQLSDPALTPLLATHGYRIDAVYHLFGAGRVPATGEECRAARDALDRLVDAAAGLGTRMIYMLTGGRGAMSWRHAADRFCAAVAPCAERARQAGVALAIENASSLYADLHIAHSLRDTITLAEMAGVGICIDLFHCWAEADLPDLVDRALPRTELVQLSDYVLGDRSLPARAVPGDGAIPVEPFVDQVLAGGYAHGFDLELIGPRIEAEGRAAAARRACVHVGALLDRLGT